ncbi:MAG: sugar phosphorylase [Thermodesulfobacteriota bacterium]|nr:sugar phosphorylase [Thermodesulfobacteriota bacterium]
MNDDKAIQALLNRIYGDDAGERAFAEIRPVMERYAAKQSRKTDFFSHEDAILITYGDSLNASDHSPLSMLDTFLNDFLTEAFSAVHILPFFPYSSDDGFSVIDFFTVNPGLGDWDDIRRIGRHRDLMVDFVLNHISSQSDWFQKYLNNDAGFEDLAIEADDDDDLSQVVRPRTTPVCHSFEKDDGTMVNVWTTFSRDQVDLNYSSPRVLALMLEVLLFYVENGAAILRLDAVAYLWKEIGTTCIHLPQTHDMVKLFRAVLNVLSPDTVIITETNVPHHENISYFGNGVDEAQMVYNFTLPPLLVYTFIQGDTTELTRWAQTLKTPSDQTTFFNFTASHDGIGVRPLEGILSEQQIDLLVQRTLANNGQVSYKSGPGGKKIPYELNTTYIDALSRPEDDDEIRALRFLASQAIQMALPGVPGVYIHSLFGTRNWHEGVAQTGRARTINRKPLDFDHIVEAIKTPGTLTHRIFPAYVNMLKIRRRQPAFHPTADFSVRLLSSDTMTIQRTCERQTILAVTNVSADSVTVASPMHANNATMMMTDLINDMSYPTDKNDKINLAPFQTIWLADAVF